MKLDLIISSEDIKQSKIKDKVVVVIDMLRATTVMITALKNGCKEVIPVLTVEEAFEAAQNFRYKYILGGERQAVKIDGFDCSNSPLEYTEDVVRDKSIVMTTTNGTKAINRCIEAKTILVGALINAKAVAEKLCKINEDVVFVNAGTNGQFSMDDFICSGYIIHLIMENKNVEFTDIVFTANQVYETHEDVLSFIKNARHYSVIQSLGLYQDLQYCCSKDITNIVPYYKNGIIKI